MHLNIWRLSDATVSEDAGIERDAILALAVRPSNHFAESHPHLAKSNPLVDEILWHC